MSDSLSQPVPVSAATVVPTGPEGSPQTVTRVEEQDEQLQQDENVNEQTQVEQQTQQESVPPTVDVEAEAESQPQPGTVSELDQASAATRIQRMMRGRQARNEVNAMKVANQQEQPATAEAAIDNDIDIDNESSYQPDETPQPPEQSHTQQSQPPVEPAEPVEPVITQATSAESHSRHPSTSSSSTAPAAATATPMMVGAARPAALALDATPSTPIPTQPATSTSSLTMDTPLVGPHADPSPGNFSFLSPAHASRRTVSIDSPGLFALPPPAQGGTTRKKLTREEELANLTPEERIEYDRKEKKWHQEQKDVNLCSQQLALSAHALVFSPSVKKVRVLSRLMSQETILEDDDEAAGDGLEELLAKPAKGVFDAENTDDAKPIELQRSPSVQRRPSMLRRTSSVRSSAKESTAIANLPLVHTFTLHNESPSDLCVLIVPESTCFQVQTPMPAYIKYHATLEVSIALIDLPHSSPFDFSTFSLKIRLKRCTELQMSSYEPMPFWNATMKRPYGKKMMKLEYRPSEKGQDVRQKTKDVEKRRELVAAAVHKDDLLSQDLLSSERTQREIESRKARHIQSLDHLTLLERERLKHDSEVRQHQRMLQDSTKVWLEEETRLRQTHRRQRKKGAAERKVMQRLKKMEEENEDEANKAGLSAADAALLEAATRLVDQPIPWLSSSRDAFRPLAPNSDKVTPLWGLAAAVLPKGAFDLPIDTHAQSQSKKSQKESWNFGAGGSNAAHAAIYKKVRAPGFVTHPREELGGSTPIGSPVSSVDASTSPRDFPSVEEQKSASNDFSTPTDSAVASTRSFKKSSSTSVLTPNSSKRNLTSSNTPTRSSTRSNTSVARTIINITNRQGLHIAVEEKQEGHHDGTPASSSPFTTPNKNLKRSAKTTTNVETPSTRSLVGGTPISPDSRLLQPKGKPTDPNAPTNWNEVAFLTSKNVRGFVDSFYHFLVSLGASSSGVVGGAAELPVLDGIAIPDTILLRHGQPHCYYYTGSNQEVREKMWNKISPAKAVARFEPTQIHGKQTEQGFQNSIVGTLLVAPPADAASRTPEFLPFEDVSILLSDTPPSLDGNLILQQFVRPSGHHHEQYRAVWTLTNGTNTFQLKKRSHMRTYTDLTIAPSERLILWDAPTSDLLVEEDISHGPLHRKFMRVMEGIATHIAGHAITHQLRPIKLSIVFQKGMGDKWYLLYADGINYGSIFGSNESDPMDQPIPLPNHSPLSPYSQPISSSGHALPGSFSRGPGSAGGTRPAARNRSVSPQRKGATTSADMLGPIVGPGTHSRTKVNRTGSMDARVALLADPQRACVKCHDPATHTITLATIIQRWTPNIFYSEPNDLIAALSVSNKSPPSVIDPSKKHVNVCDSCAASATGGGGGRTIGSPQSHVNNTSFTVPPPLALLTPTRTQKTNNATHAKTTTPNGILFMPANYGQ